MGGLLDGWIGGWVDGMGWGKGVRWKDKESKELIK
jgi:hypothetical protein